MEATSDTSSTTVKFFIRLDTLENLGNVQRDANNLDFTATVSPSIKENITFCV